MKPRLLTAFACVAGLTAPLPAQSTAPAGRVPATEEVVRLSPFSVNTDRDTGYLATDSLVGGRINTELIRTPNDVSVLTKDFLNDIGATNYLDAVPFMTSAVPQPVASADFGTTVSFRGMPAGFQARNYFRVLYPMDAYMIERIETVRGASALLFGDGAVGGMVNTLTKRAKPQRNVVEAQARVDSEGSRRAALDYNRSLGRSVAVRLNAVADEGRSWVDRYFANRYSADLTATYRPFEGAELRVEGEHGNIRTNYAPFNAVDSFSGYNGTYVVTGPLTASPSGTGVSRVSTDSLVVSPSQGGGVINFLNTGSTTGTNFAIAPTERSQIPNFPRVARNFSVQPRNAYEDIAYTLAGVTFEREWKSGLVAEAGVQFARVDRMRGSPFFNTYRLDVNQVLPGGAPNPKFGKVYSDSTWRPTTGNNFNSDYRLGFSYPLPVRAWSQRLNVSLSRRIEAYDVEIDAYGRTNNPAQPLAAATANEVVYRVYWDDPQIDLHRPVSGNGYTFGTVRVRDLSSRSELDSGQASTVINAWSDRLTLIAGARRDEFRKDDLEIDPASVNAAGHASRRNRTTVAAKITTLSAGAVVFPIKTLGLFVNYAESFNPPLAGFALNGSPIAPTDSNSTSGGLRFRLLGGRIVGSLGAYEITEAGRGLSFSAAEINRIWTQLNLGQNQFPATTYLDTLDYKGKGMELDFVANVSRNFRVLGNYSRPRTSQDNTVAGLRSYLARHLATWTAANDPQINQDTATLQARVVSSNAGRVINNTPDYTGSLYGNYTLPEGTLKGLRVGGGFSVQGPIVIGNQVGRPFDYVKSDAYYLANATLGYTLKVRGSPVNLQLNVTNLFDHDEPIFTSTGTFAGATLRNGFRFVEPRKAAFTASVQF